MCKCLNLVVLLPMFANYSMKMMFQYLCNYFCNCYIIHGLPALYVVCYSVRCSFCMCMCMLGLQVIVNTVCSIKINGYIEK
jgi:hypothetical protein